MVITYHILRPMSGKIPYIQSLKKYSIYVLMYVGRYALSRIRRMEAKACTGDGWTLPGTKRDLRRTFQAPKKHVVR